MPLPSPPHFFLPKNASLYYYSSWQEQHARMMAIPLLAEDGRVESIILGEVRVGEAMKEYEASWEREGRKKNPRESSFQL